MKKIICMILCVAMCFSILTVSAASAPEFMKNIYTNYTVGYKVSMNIENAEEIIDFLNELEMPEEVNNYIDLQSLIESLCRVNSDIKVSLEASKDLRKIKAELAVDTKKNVVFNRNFTTSYSANMGIWVDMDVDSRKFVVMYLTPLNEKYAVIDFAKDVPEEVSNALFDKYDEMLNPEFMKKSNNEILDIVTNYADISMKGSTCTVKYDNDAFVKAFDDVIDYLKKNYSGPGEPATPFSDIPSFEGIKLLGDKGVTCTYKLNGKKIKSFTENWDISLSLSDIYAKTEEEAWPYESKGDINLSLKIEGNVNKIGTTRIALPVITEENSFSIAELFYADEYEDAPDGWEDKPYVSYYSCGWIENDTFDGERYYMPVRLCIEEAYVGCSDITYDNGVVTIATTSGEEGKDISAIFKVGQDKAVVNGVAYDGFGAFKMIDGSVYASVEFYEECLGWELETLDKNLLDGSLYYDFCTYNMFEDYENITED